MKPDPSSLEEYAEYANKLSLKQLTGVLHYLDRDEFPDRYKIVEEIIDDKIQAPITEAQSEQPQIHKPPAGLTTSRHIYFVLISFGLLGGIAKTTTGGLDIEYTLSTLFDLSLFSLIFYGLVKVRKWVVTLVLVFASLSLFAELINSFATSELEGPALFAGRIMGIFLALFWFYQITLFSQKQTRQYFKEKGTTFLI